MQILNKTGIPIRHPDFRKTKYGLIYNLYQRNLTRSRTLRWGDPEYDVEWLEEFIMALPHFHTMYDKWVLSGHDTDLKPSVDRLDSKGTYTKKNIQIITWLANKQKERLEITKKASKVAVHSREVKQALRFKDIDPILIGILPGKLSPAKINELETDKCNARSIYGRYLVLKERLQ